MEENQINNYNWIEDLPEGWWKLARAMIYECESIYPEWEITDLKEKWGAIRCYDSGVPSTLRNKIDKILDQYENLSSKTCCRCGKPATKISTGWILPFCDDCIDENKTYKKIMS